MPPRIPLAILALIAAAPSVAVRTAAAQQPISQPVQHVGSLSSFDYVTRMNAARRVRRAVPAEVVPVLADAVRGHTDEFVRYRALVLLTGFDDPGTPDLGGPAVPHRHDRIREVVYRWFERRPDPALAESLVAALQTEQSEFVRPALVRAVAALPGNEMARRALLAEIGRGFDFFRGAVIEALGEYRAAYAAEAIAAVAAIEGPLQDDAVLALGRMGDARGRGTTALAAKVAPEVTAAVQAAECLLGDACASRIDWLVSTARHSDARPEAVHAAVAALGAVAGLEAGARNALLQLAGAPERGRTEATVAIGAWALRQPAATVAWIAELPEPAATAAVDVLRDAFDRLEEDFAEEQFFAAARAAYWSAADESATRRVAAALIDRLDF